MIKKTGRRGRNVVPQNYMSQTQEDINNPELGNSLSPPKAKKEIATEKKERISASYKTFDMVQKLLKNGSTTKKFFDRYGSKDGTDLKNIIYSSSHASPVKLQRKSIYEAKHVKEKNQKEQKKGIYINKLKKTVQKAKAIGYMTHAHIKNKDTKAWTQPKDQLVVKIDQLKAKSNIYNEENYT